MNTAALITTLVTVGVILGTGVLLQAGLIPDFYGGIALGAVGVGGPGAAVLVGKKTPPADPPTS